MDPLDLQVQTWCLRQSTQIHQEMLNLYNQQHPAHPIENIWVQQPRNEQGSNQDVRLEGYTRGYLDCFALWTTVHQQAQQNYTENVQQEAVVESAQYLNPAIIGVRSETTNATDQQMDVTSSGQVGFQVTACNHQGIAHEGCCELGRKLGVMSEQEYSYGQRIRKHQPIAQENESSYDQNLNLVIDDKSVENRTDSQENDSSYDQNLNLVINENESSYDQNLNLVIDDKSVENRTDSQDNDSSSAQILKLSIDGGKSSAAYAYRQGDDSSDNSSIVDAKSIEADTRDSSSDQKMDLSINDKSPSESLASITEEMSSLQKMDLSTSDNKSSSEPDSEDSEHSATLISE